MAPSRPPLPPMSSEPPPASMLPISFIMFIKLPTPPSCYNSLGSIAFCICCIIALGFRYISFRSLGVLSFIFPNFSTIVLNLEYSCKRNTTSCG
jgi:hypothetical protein